MKKVDSGVKFCYAVCNKRSIKVVNIDRRETKEGLMKKINVKATIFLSAIVLVVVVLLLNLIEFRKTVDFTVPGIQMPKENAFGKQRIREGEKRGWLDRNPGCPDHRSDLSGGTECGKRDDIRRESRQLCFISGGNTGRSLCHSGYMVSGNAGE